MVRGCVVVEDSEALAPWEQKTLSEFWWIPVKSMEEAFGGNFDYVLQSQRDEWNLWPLKFKPRKPFGVNFLSEIFLNRVKGFGAADPLAKAMGRSTPSGLTLLDASAGWLQDSLSLAKRGYHVTAKERNPTVYLMVRSALEHALRSSSFADLISGTIDYQFGPSDTEEDLSVWDIVYFDPMFTKEGKKTLPDKSMQILADIVGTDPDEQRVFKALVKKAKSRVVVKRSPHNQPLDTPDYSLTSKTVRYDIYLTR